MRLILVPTALVIAAVFAFNARAGGGKQPKESTMLVEPAALAALAKKLKAPELRILDARTPEEYAKGHIPGAVRVDVKAWTEQGKKDNGFRDAKAWAKLVGALGIARDSHIVVYGSNLTDTARVWWTLKYLGMEHVAILDGGWSAWTKEKLPTETTTPAPRTASFEPKFQADRLEEIDTLKKSLKSDKVKIVDTRSEGEFKGTVVKGKRGGHIPGATLLEWKDLLAEDGRFKTPEQLRELFKKRGILPDSTAVCY